jgi:hypothetical protein
MPARACARREANSLIRFPESGIKVRNIRFTGFAMSAK